MELTTLTAFNAAPTPVEKTFTKVDKIGNVVFLRAAQVDFPFAGHAHQDMVFSCSSVKLGDGGRRFTLKLEVPFLTSEDGGIVTNYDAYPILGTITFRVGPEHNFRNRDDFFQLMTDLLLNQDIRDSITNNEGIY
jgi:hypothetical protein